MTTTDAPFSFDDDEDEEEEWFGEDSPFDSGEDLAAALVAMAGGDASALFAGLTDQPEPEQEEETYSEFETFESTARRAPPVAPTREASPWALSPPSAPPQQHLASRQEQLDAVLSRVQPANRAPVPTTWTSRNSTKVMKITAQLMEKLRDEAIGIAWKSAEEAVQQREPRKRRPTDADVAA